MSACRASCSRFTTACGLLDTETPDIVQPPEAETPAGAQARRAGAFADWVFIRDGDGTEFVDGEILLTGLMADEFVLSTTPPGEQEVDQRKISVAGIEADSLFLLMHRARAEAEDAADALQRLSPTPDEEPGIAEMLTVAGYTYIAFGEDFCSGVPFSKVDGDTIAFGQPQTTQQVFDLAIARFDAALAHPGISEDIANLATVGKARALVNRGRRDRRRGRRGARCLGADRFPVRHRACGEPPADPERDLPVRPGLPLVAVGPRGRRGPAVPDSRRTPGCPSRDQEDVGLDGTTPQFTLDKYPDAASPVVVADGIEARLIEAEAQLRANNFSGMRTRLNVLRAGADLGLSNLPTPGSLDEAIDQLFSERAFWMFATGHRLGDLRRLVRQYGRSPDAVFPSGDYLKGGAYGTDLNFPIPRSEDSSNPNSNGCLNRDA